MNGIDWSSSETQILSIDGIGIEARRWGPAPDTAMTLVLLHEGLGSVAMWRDFPEKLARETGMGVLAYSRQGYGKSDPCTLPRPLDYMEREASQVLPKLLDLAGIRRCLLIGHSDGASIAALHQQEQDGRVSGLVLMAPHFFVEDISVESIEIAGTAWRETDLPDRLGKYHEDAENAFLGWNGAWLDPAFRNWNIADCINAFRVPCLAIQGRQDGYGTAAQIEAIALRSKMPVEPHLLDDCEHAPHKDQPQHTLSLISDFARRIAETESVSAT